MKCMRCGGTELIDDALVIDSLEERTRVRVHKNPSAFLFKGSVSVRLKARVCGICGHVELYTDKPEKLLAAHRQAEINKSPEYEHSGPL